MRAENAKTTLLAWLGGVAFLCLLGWFGLAPERRGKDTFEDRVEAKVQQELARAREQANQSRSLQQREATRVTPPTAPVPLMTLPKGVGYLPPAKLGVNPYATKQSAPTPSKTDEGPTSGNKVAPGR